MKRFGTVIGLKPEKVEEYKRLHAAVWPDVLKTVRECNIRNYSIYLKQLENGEYYLFSYYEYAGANLAADFAKMSADPITQKWWGFCKPCQIWMKDGGGMEEVFHVD